MCGIAGLFFKDPQLVPQLGNLLEEMIVALSSRGPDSAGFAVYTDDQPGRHKITMRIPNWDEGSDAEGQEALIGAVKQLTGEACRPRVCDNHWILSVPAQHSDDVVALLRSYDPNVDVMSVGTRMEIYKEVGMPEDVTRRFDLASVQGTHGIGHTRMATESAVTTLGAHPFSTGCDQCLVHNGSLSNHNHLRRALQHQGMRFDTENDTEVAAAFLTAQMSQGLDLGQALESCLAQVDGFYNFVVGTESGFGVLRDPIGCKPATMAETRQYVAFASEYQALTGLPNIQQARVWEPEPTEVYFWDLDQHEPMRAVQGGGV